MSSGDFIFVRKQGQLLKIPLSSVIYLKAEDKYVTVKHEEGEALIEESLKSLSVRFPDLFRVHRNCLINVDHLIGLRTGGGSIKAFMTGMDELNVSRRRVAEFRRMFKRSAG